jgi:hypothetical protein
VINFIRLKPQKDTVAALRQLQSIGGYLEIFRYDAVAHEMIFVQFTPDNVPLQVARMSGPSC